MMLPLQGHEELLMVAEGCCQLHHFEQASRPVPRELPRLALLLMMICQRKTLFEASICFPVFVVVRRDMVEETSFWLHQGLFLFDYL